MCVYACVYVCVCVRVCVCVIAYMLCDQWGLTQSTWSLGTAFSSLEGSSSLRMNELASSWLSPLALALTQALCPHMCG